jgi:hypothetical protein
LVFQKKKLNIATAEHDSTVPKNNHEKQQKCCFSNPAVGQQKLVGPTKQNQFCFLYQTLKCVVTGEPHPQPHYQTA